VWQVDEEADIHPVPAEPSHHSHVAVPTFFNRRKEEFKCFQCQVELFITANKSDFRTDKSMTLFTLSYMTKGSELWANTFVNEMLETGDWGLWSNFLETMAWDFRDSEEPRWALEEIR
jgi:hypothetical protein